MPRRNTNNISPVDVSTFIVSSIRNPNNPEHCGACLAGALMEFTRFKQTPYTGRYFKQVVRDPEFWEGILAFLLLKRTDEQLDRLLTRLSQCFCQKYDADIRRFHTTGLEWEVLAMSRMHMKDEDDSGAFTPGRCSLIINIFCVMSSLLLRTGVMSLAKGILQYWPLHVTDLIPYGPDNFVESMLQWYRFVPDTAIFQYTALVLRMCMTLVIPSLVKYRFTHAVVDSCRQLVDLTMADFTKDLNEPGHRKRLSERFKFRISDYSVYFLTLKELYARMPDCYGELIHGCETKAIQLCSIILYLSSDPNMPSRGIPDIVEEFVWHGQSLFRFFYMHLYPRPDLLVHPLVERLDSETFPIPAIYDNPAHMALNSILRFRGDRHCSAYICPNILQTAGKNFQRCSRCKVAPYCGRECQTNAWRDQTYPHKETCSVLLSLVSCGGGRRLFFGEEVDFPTVIKNWNEAGIQEDEFLLIGEWYKAISESRGYPMPDRTEWTPGYDDYNEIIAKLTANGRGPKAKYLDRLARSSSEVAAEEHLLKAQPFWGVDIFY